MHFEYFFDSIENHENVCNNFVFFIYSNAFKMKKKNIYIIFLSQTI